MNDVSPPPPLFIYLYVFIYFFYFFYFDVFSFLLPSRDCRLPLLCCRRLTFDDEKSEIFNHQLRQQFAAQRKRKLSCLVAICPFRCFSYFPPCCSLPFICSSSSSSISQPVLPNWVFVMIITWLGAITPLPTGLIPTGIDTSSLQTFGAEVLLKYKIWGRNWIFHFFFVNFMREMVKRKQISNFSNLLIWFLILYAH